MPDRLSINDELFDTAKAYERSGRVPFPGHGGSGYGAAPIYTSWAAWDSALDNWGGSGEYDRTAAKYQSKLGDLFQNSLVMSAVRFLGNVLPEAPLQVMEGTDAEGNDKAVEDHPLIQLWNRPNEFYSGSTLKKGIAFSWVLNSQAYIIKKFNLANTDVVELWYEPHWTIRPVWPVDGSKFIDHYEVNRDGAWIPLPVRNVIHLRDGLHPYNQRVGLSGMGSIIRELFGDAEAANYYAQLMGGSAVPPFIVGIDKDVKMNEEQLERFTNTLISKTVGERRGEPIVAKGATAYKLAFTPRELDLRETRYMPEERFCAVTGIPAVVLELGSGQAHSIYNNVKQAMERAYYSYVIPLLRHIEEELTVQLLDDFEEKDFDGNLKSGRWIRHDLSKVQALQEDEDAKATRMSMLYEKGVIMRSEARSGLGFGPSDPKDKESDKIFAVDPAADRAAAEEQQKQQQELAEKQLEAKTQMAKQLPAATGIREQPGVKDEREIGKEPGALPAPAGIKGDLEVRLGESNGFERFIENNGQNE